MKTSKTSLWVMANKLRIHLRYLCRENPYIVTNDTKAYLREMEQELINNIEDAPKGWKVCGNGYLIN